MPEYIDREKAKGILIALKNECWDSRVNPNQITGIVYSINELNKVPTEDVVPVVKCSQCRKRYTTECALWFSQLDDKQYFCGAIHNDDFYCSYGERKDK